MAKKMTNISHIEGYLYQHDLALKTVANKESKNYGTEFISGTIDIATNDAMTNIVQIHFTFVTPTTSTGKSNATYNMLKNILDGKIGTYMQDGKDGAGKLSVDSAIALNEFYTDRNGKEELVSVKRNEGGFVHNADFLNDNEEKRATFREDMIITNVTHVDPDEERQIPEHCLVKGYIFNFRNSIMPVEFTCKHPDGITYFEGLELPIFTLVEGKQVSEVIIRTIVEQSAFGEDSVREVRSSRKGFEITRANPQPYDWDSEETITVAEIKEFLAQRETDLATMKHRSDEWKAQQNANKAPVTNNGGFNF